MLLYKPTQEFFERMRSNKFIVKQATLENEKLILIVVDSTSDKAIKLFIYNPQSSNDNFNLTDTFLIDVTIESFHKVYKTKYFIVKSLELRDLDNNICKIERGL